MSYRTPLQDIRFILQELVDLEGLLALPNYQALSQDLIDAVLEENARFVENRVAALNVEGDHHPAVWDNGQVRTAPGFREVYEDFVHGGWQGLAHAPELGGQGLPRVLGAAVSENLNAACLSFALCPLLTEGVIDALSLVGSPAQQALFLPPLLEGRWTGTMNLTEPQAGSDLSLLKSSAQPQGDGSYRISGQKIFITYGDHDMAENIIHLVLARTPGAPKGVKGISLFLVPKFLVGEDGSLGRRNDVYCASLEHKLGIHASPTAVLLYGAGQAGEETGAVGYLIGEENRGLEYMFIMMNAARFAVGIQGVALSERALQKATAFAGERIQGQAPDGPAGPVAIAHHPDVQRMLGIMRGLTEGARALAYVAAAHRDRAAGATDPAEQASHRRLYEYCVPIVKAFCTEAAVETASLGVQVHGGMGFIEETGAAQYYRDARILPIYEGTTAIQANDFISRKIARDAGAVAREQLAQMGQTVAQLREAGQANGGLLLIADRLEAAAAAYGASVEHMVAQMAGQVRAAYMGSVPILMQAGTVHAGWELARSALAAARALAQGSNHRFHEAKISTAVLYAVHVLPRSLALGSAVADGVLADQYAAGLLSVS